MSEQNTKRKRVFASYVFYVWLWCVHMGDICITYSIIEVDVGENDLKIIVLEKQQRKEL